MRWPVLLLLTTASALVTAQSADRLAEIQTRIASIKSTLATRQESARSLSDELAQAEKLLAQASLDQEAYQAQVAQAETRLGQLQADFAVAREANGQSADALSATVRAVYLARRQGPLQVLLSHSDPATLTRRLTYQQLLLDAARRDLDQRREELDALAREANNLQAEKSKLVALNDQALAHQQAMTELRSTRAEALAGLQQQIDADREMLAELEADAAALSTLVRGLPRPGQNRPLPDTGGSTAKSLAQPPSGPATPGSLQEQDIDRAKGKLPWPATGRIVQTPGSRQRAGGAVWNGMLIATEPAAEVHAIAAGTVVFADEFRNLGLLVIVDHGQEYLSLYGYNQAVHRQAGDHVSAGDLLAEVGAHGTAGQYALYFELRHNGAALDPRQWLLPR